MRRAAKAFACAGLLTLLGVAAGRPAKAHDPVTASKIPMPQYPIHGPGANLPDEYYMRGIKEAPNLLKAAQVLCTATQAAYIGLFDTLDNQIKRTGDAEIYEAACGEGLGYLIVVAKDKPPLAVDCIQAAQLGTLACILPKNSHPAGGLAPYLKAAGVNCTALRARQIVENTNLKQRKYEVECQGGGGYILDIYLPDGTGPAPEAVNCLKAGDGCTFTSHVDNVVMLEAAVGRALGSDCRISDARYVGNVEATQRDLYEVACQVGHDGLLLELDRSGVVRSVMPCASTNLKGVSCQLKPSDVTDPLIAQAQISGAAPPPAPARPSWKQLPTGDDFAAVYPSEARAHGLAGQATLVCGVDVAGALVHCFAIDESPAGYGFGQAALKLSVKFRMTPVIVRGVPRVGRVTIPIRFALGR